MLSARFFLEDGFRPAHWRTDPALGPWLVLSRADALAIQEFGDFGVNYNILEDDLNDALASRRETEAA